mmetsp:Transcript_8277/g.15409  ORF Transcript_8277/g.15409 Transcript_8277/m.15409 type:complete len:105 (-) Transcript_8277:412-726(-)
MLPSVYVKQSEDAFKEDVEEGTKRLSLVTSTDKERVHGEAFVGTKFQSEGCKKFKAAVDIFRSKIETVEQKFSRALDMVAEFEGNTVAKKTTNEIVTSASGLVS